MTVPRLRAKSRLYNRSLRYANVGYHHSHNCNRCICIKCSQHLHDCNWHLHDCGYRRDNVHTVLCTNLNSKQLCHFICSPKMVRRRISIFCWLRYYSTARFGNGLHISVFLNILTTHFTMVTFHFGYFLGDFSKNMQLTCKNWYLLDFWHFGGLWGRYFLIWLLFLQIFWQNKYPSNSVSVIISSNDVTIFIGRA